VGVGICWLAASVAYGQVSVAPSSVNIAYVQGAAQPVAQKIAVKAANGTPSYTTAIKATGTTPSALWLTATPDIGMLPANVNLQVNPTSLQAGKYTAAVAFTGVGAGAPGTVNVTLLVTAQSPTLRSSTASLAFATTPTAPPAVPPAVAPQTVQLSTSGGPISFSVAADMKWLTIAPNKGLVLPGAPVTLTVTADATTLAPAAVKSPYKAKITITTSGASNKTLAIPVTFSVVYQNPSVTGIWPGTGQVGGKDTTVTIYGINFCSGTVAKINTGATPVALKTQYLNPDVISVVIPAKQLAAGSDLTIYASNPAPGGDSLDHVTFGFGQSVDVAVSAASYLPGGSPGDLITLFGTNIGPPVPATQMETTPPYADQVLSGFTVTVDGQKSAMVYASQDQISVQVPYEVDATCTPSCTKPIVVTNGTITANGTIDIQPTAPGIFTADGSGAGQAAASNADGSLNSSGNPAKMGSVMKIYLTGEGIYTNTPAGGADGYIIPVGSIPLPVSGICPGGSVCMPALQATPVSVTLGPLPGAAGAPFAVPAANVSAGPFVGGMLGILELDLTVPAGGPTGTAVPIVVTIGGVATQAGVTISTKP